MSRSGSDTRQRTVILQVRLSPAERDLLTDQAAAYGVSRSELIRSAGLLYRLSPAVSPEAIATATATRAQLNEQGNTLAAWLESTATVSVENLLDSLSETVVKLTTESAAFQVRSRATKRWQADAETGERIVLRATPEEAETLLRKATLAGLKTPAFLKAAALDAKLYAAADRDAIELLAQTYGDAGRVAGLLKLWLTEQKKSAAGYNKTIKDNLLKIKTLREEIENGMVMLSGRKQRRNSNVGNRKEKRNDR